MSCDLIASFVLELYYNFEFNAGCLLAVLCYKLNILSKNKQSTVVTVNISLYYCSKKIQFTKVTKYAEMINRQATTRGENSTKPTQLGFFFYLLGIHHPPHFDFGI